MGDATGGHAGEIGERSTLGSSPFDPASECRKRGWGPGTRLVGDEGYGPTVIEITAVGQRLILAKTISHNGTPDRSIDNNEGSWVLWCRDWTVVSGSSVHSSRPPVDEGAPPADG